MVNNYGLRKYIVWIVTLRSIPVMFNMLKINDLILVPKTADVKYVLQLILLFGIPDTEVVKIIQYL